ncbi:hypothetical protein D3C80_1791200 [compost metagenome]
MQLQRRVAIRHGFERAQVNAGLKALDSAADIGTHLLKQVAVACVMPIEISQAQLRAAL